MYFFELTENYTTKSWYVALRGGISVGLGVLALIVPSVTTNAVLVIFGLWIIANALIQMAPVLRGHASRHLWPQTIGTGVSAVLVGLVLVVFRGLALAVLGIILGLLLFFRTGLELTILVETPIRVRYQRALLLGVLASVLAGIALMISPFMFTDDHAFERLVGLYVIVHGVLNLVHAWGISETVEESEVHAQTLVSQHREIPILDEAQAAAEDMPPLDRSGWVPARPGDTLDPAKYQRPLVLAPHPDDLEGFAGGLVAKLAHGVTSVVFAGGDRGRWGPKYAHLPRRDYIRVRLEESADAARLLGITEIVYMGYFDRGVACTPEAVDKVLDVLRAYQPDLVVSFEFYRWATPYPHPDHIAAAQIVRRAVARYEQHDCLDYLVTATLFPNTIVDVSGVRRVKLEALACHTTQTGLNRVIFPFFEKFMTRLWGAFKGVDFAEGYRLVAIPALVEHLHDDEL